VVKTGSCFFDSKIEKEFFFSRATKQCLCHVYVLFEVRNKEHVYVLFGETKSVCVFLSLFSKQHMIHMTQTWSEKQRAREEKRERKTCFVYAVCAVYLYVCVCMCMYVGACTGECAPVIVFFSFCMHMRVCCEFVCRLGVCVCTNVCVIL